MILGKTRKEENKYRDGRESEWSFMENEAITFQWYIFGKCHQGFEWVLSCEDYEQGGFAGFPVDCHI